MCEFIYIPFDDLPVWRVFSKKCRRFGERVVPLAINCGSMLAI